MFKKFTFFAGSAPVRNQPLFCALRPLFQKFLVRILNCSATRHPSGSRSMKKKLTSTVASPTEIQDFTAAQPSFFSYHPWSVSGPQKMHRYPAMSNWMRSHNFGLLAGQPLRAHDRGRSSQKAIRLDLSLRQCNDVPITKKGYFPSLHPGSPLQCQTNVRSALVGTQPDLS